MKTSDSGVDFIVRQEGLKTEMYRDFIGLPTIGVGHLLTKDELYSGKIDINGEQIPWHAGLTADQVRALLHYDLITAETIVNSDSSGLSQVQFDALVSFTFNVGGKNYSKSTLRKKLLLGQLDQVPEQMKRWVYAAGLVSPILERRRQLEADLWNYRDVVEG